MRKAVIVAAALLAACASNPAPKQPFPSFDPDARPAAGTATRDPGAVQAAPAVETANVATIDPVAYAKRHPRAEFCEEAARKLQPSSRDKAWDVLKACIGRGRFTLLERLVDGGWSDELRTRPDASVLLAKVIAARGGDVTGDLGQVRRQRIPLFAIGPALNHPDLYKGRLVIFRGEVRDMKLAAGKATAKLAEFAIGNSETFVAEGNRTARYSASKSSYSNSDDYSSSRSRSSASVRQEERRLTSNVPVETGLEILAKLAKPDPFFEPGRQFVVLARFDGVREEEGEELDAVKKIASVSVIAYHEPSANMVE